MSKNKLIRSNPFLFASNDNVFEINSLSDFLSFLKLKRDFKVVWCLTNTIVHSVNTAILSYVDYKPITNLKYQEVLEIEANVLLSNVVDCLLSYDLDCTYLWWIPGTLWWAVVNNSWSWKLWRSILDNVEYIIYYDNQGSRFYLHKRDLVFWKRFSQFKFGNNIFIYKIWLKFPRKKRSLLQEELMERQKYRTEKFDKCSYSLWSLFLKTKNEIVSNIESNSISVKDNKIFFSGIPSLREIQLFLKKACNLYLSEKEIEFYDDFFQSRTKYAGYFIYDSFWRFLLQQRDYKKTIQNSWKIGTFWWALNKDENIISWLQREVYEELWILINNNDIDSCFLFLKERRKIKRQTLCFIFVKQVEDIFNYIKNIKCSEWKIFIDDYNDFDNIMKDDRYSTIAKKIILYTKQTNNWKKI